MLGAIAGDIIGSVYEWRPVKTTDFPLFQPGSRFTDDTVMTVAVARAILSGGGYAGAMREFGRRYPDAGYGGMFAEWLMTDGMGPYNSWGNGSAMRVSPVGWAFDTAEEVLAEAKRSAEVTHDYPEGIRGAEAVALAVFLARKGAAEEEVRAEVEGRFGYDLSRTVEDIRPGYSFDVSCRGSVPEAIISALGSTGYEDAVRKGVSLGGDSDTIGCMAGSVAEALHGGVPEEIAREAERRLPPDLLDVCRRFRREFMGAG